MEGIERRPSYLELTMAMPGYSHSSGSDVGGGCHMIKGLDMNQPACGMEEEFSMATTEEDDESTTPRPKKLRLSKEQCCLLEESFRQNQTLDPDVGGGCHMNRDLDMNQPACGMEELEFPMAMTEDDDESTTPRPTKLRLSSEQCRLLGESFRQNHTLDPKQKETLAFRLKLRQRQVEVWFQNRRARTKLKQMEVECQYMKRCFRSTEENKRLKREVAELRSVRVARPTMISPRTCEPVPASSLTFCPCCERVMSAEFLSTWAPSGTP